MKIVLNPEYEERRMKTFTLTIKNDEFADVLYQMLKQMNFVSIQPVISEPEQKEENEWLKPKPYFPPTTIEEVAGCLAYHGESKSQSDYEKAIQKGITEEWNGIG